MSSINETSEWETRPALRRAENYDGPCRLSGDDFADEAGTYELTVKEHFDAAHSLPGYDGPCQYLHGHTWDVEVVIEGRKLDDVGMLYDFKDIKRDLRALLSNFDHRFINDVPPFDDINPTAEHMARVLFFELSKTMPDDVRVKEVGVWESPLAKVTFKRG